MKRKANKQGKLTKPKTDSLTKSNKLITFSKTDHENYKFNSVDEVGKLFEKHNLPKRRSPEQLYIY